MRLNDALASLLSELGDFDYGLSSVDHIWNILFPDHRAQWHHLHVNKYRQTYYLSHVDAIGDNHGGLEVGPKTSVRATSAMGLAPSLAVQNDDCVAKKWEPLISSARKWLKVVRRDWIKANKQVQLEYPLNRRHGLVPNALIRASLSDVYRIDRELGKAKTGKLVRLVETGFFTRKENTELASMTAADYFNYCKIAYIAGRRREDHVDESQSGREMYMRYADGRHEGLLDIDETSEQELADWLDGVHPMRKQGGHPWEIKRGGNTTHINLSVMRPSYSNKEGFKVLLCGASISRIVETMRMLLAINEASLPISITDPEGMRKRLLAQDNIGIVPCYSSLHRAHQRFREDDHVFDVMHYDDLGRFKRRVHPFIRWEPLPIFKPRDV